VVEIGDIGEVYVAGSHLCSGYVNNREMDRFILNLIDKDEPGIKKYISYTFFPAGINLNYVFKGMR